MAEESPAPVAPDNHQKWLTLTSTTMSKARNQSSDMLSRLQRYEAAEAAAKEASQEQAKREKEAVKTAARKRMKCHEVVIDASQKCIQEVEEAMQTLEGVMNRLKQERYLRFADSQVNERRSTLRAERPLAESFKDQLHNNLEREKTTLAAARKELLEREEEVKKLHEALAQVRIELSFDMGARRLQVEHEAQLLRPSLAPSGPPRGKDKDATALPPVNGAEAPDSPKEEKPKEEAPKQHHDFGNLPLTGAEAMQHVNKCAELVVKIESFVSKSDEAIGRSRNEARIVTSAVTKSLARRTLDLSGIKKSLETHIQDINYTISTAERSLEKQEKRLDPRNAEKKAKIDSSKQLLEQLYATKRSMVQDLRWKIDALNIDNSCRRVTAQVAAAEDKKRPESAGATRKKQMTSSNSAPSLTLENTDGGAGNSKSLKAAGTATLPATAG